MGPPRRYPHPWELRSSTYGPFTDTPEGVAWISFFQSKTISG